MTSRAYLDSNFFIRFVESEDEGLLFVFEQESAGLLELVTSELTLAEALAGALKFDDTALASHYEELLTSSDFLRVVPISRNILRQRARIRAEPGNKTPDAIHIATATAEDCSVFVSSDQRLRLPTRLVQIPLARVADLDAWP